VCCPCINSVRPQDQAKVRRAIANQRVDPADIPLSARAAAPTIAHVTPSTSQAPALRQKKRKAVFDQAAHTNSQSGSAGPAVPATTRSIIHDIDDDDEVTIIEPDPVDELYCTLRTSIVGVQYYKGECPRTLAYIYIDVISRPCRSWRGS
jgi:SWI/SNF-related matrix-associated actin-dependent regulator of chromatin subfamily A3